MYTLQINKFKISLFRYIATAIFAVFVFIFVSYAISFNEFKHHKSKDYANQIDKGLKHTIRHYIQDYTFRARRIAETTELSKMLQNNDREGALEILLPKYSLMRQENKHLKVMHVHKKDGTSWIRVHKLEKYGDNIAQHRKMLQDIHKNHNIINGYETGIYATVYRIIVPIFNHNGQYIGAFELGIEPSFILRSIKEIDGFSGVVFIKDTQLKLYSKPNNISIDGYKLQSKPTPELLEIIQSNKELKLKEKQTVFLKNKKYSTHLVTMKDFEGEESVKILFFQNLDTYNLFFNKTQFLVFGIVLILLIIISYLIYKRIELFQKNITAIYDKHYQQLENAKNNIENVFNTVPNMMMTTDGDNIIMANKCMLDHLHYATVDELKKEHKCICEFFIKQEGFLEKNMHGLNWLDYVLRYKNKINKVGLKVNDEVKYFIVYANKIILDNNNFSLVSFTDITELEILANRLDYAVSSTNDGLWDWDLVTNEVYFSDQWKAMLGYAPHELKDELKTWSDLIHPDDLHKAEEDIKKSHSKETPLYENIHRLKHKDGHWVWILDRGKTIFNEEGDPLRMIGFHTDISELKRLENELRASKEEFELFMENIPHVVVIKDENLKVLYANSHAKNYVLHDVVGKNASQNMEENSAKKINELSLLALKNGSAEDLVQIDLEKRSIMARVFAFKIPQKNKGSYIGMLYMDITDSYKDKLLIKEQEELMIAQSRHAAMGEMISMIAHQWRQPISVIAMDANNILADIELEMLDEQTLLEGAKDIIVQTSELSKTIDDFRNFFKPDKIPENTLISDVIDDVLNVILKSLENNNIQVELNLEPDLTTLTYSRELMQVLINLVKNAKEALIEHTKEERKITINSYKQKDNAIIEVVDNGGGIPKEIQDNIFTPYFSTKGEKNGTGLGLYMSKTIIEKHLNGIIQAKYLDNGVSFVISIPIQFKESQDG